MRSTYAVIQTLSLLTMAAFAGCGGSAIHPDDQVAVEALREGGVFEIQLDLEGRARVVMLREASQVTDELIAHLAGLDALNMLLLDKAPLDDALLEHLAELTHLEKLSLTGTGITDAGLSHLEALLELESLDMRATKVTQSGQSKLQKKLTNCIILVGEIATEEEEPLDEFSDEDYDDDR